MGDALSGGEFSLLLREQLSTYGAEIMHKQFNGFQLVLVDFLGKIQFTKKLAEDFPIILCITVSNDSP